MGPLTKKTPPGIDATRHPEQPVCPDTLAGQTHPLLYQHILVTLVPQQDGGRNHTSKPAQGHPEECDNELTTATYRLGSTQIPNWLSNIRRLSKRF